MGRVWFLVLLSMCLVFGVSWAWHVRGVNDQVARDKAVDDALMMETRQIALYRDVLERSGKDAAAKYLATSSQNIYGN